jgi:hypothetical protein
VHEYYWDPAKHPRGGFSQNRGWFSPTGGSSHSGPSDGVPRRVSGGERHEPTRPPTEPAHHPVALPARHLPSRSRTRRNRQTLPRTPLVAGSNTRRSSSISFRRQPDT